jgi:hypothetical protein
LAGNETVADIILGEERANPRAQFVRREAEDQCWRVLGSVLVEIEPRRWVDAELLAIPEGEVRAVFVNGLHISSSESPEGKISYQVVENSPLVMATDYEWTSSRSAVAQRTLPSWLSRLELDDVRKAKVGGVAYGFTGGPYTGSQLSDGMGAFPRLPDATYQGSSELKGGRRRRSRRGGAFAPSTDGKPAELPGAKSADAPATAVSPAGTLPSGASAPSPFSKGGRRRRYTKKAGRGYY